ncbi:hypothetical protein [Sulfolobus acidocaldarius]|uniref:Membrane protein n=4 Tax=Sulfolobus acidocaldarius TaxID=2285 RepID=Q4J759_SULAC|nr:hypothetical protein [Sulfolobus acidocaldarius]AAY81372.1 membrane protein [Sulfolobus acidocaldarius DSM 639]AGE71971.1 membrane protein [Sulfolobus acidocaldarius N8]AGE74287.1 membrane protein [Sulfolobus acidocaldarius Ron12/I]ALU29831.1 hypothetical protein ATY89_07690 [Sulfolobus acidocaldarius]ALU32570.1 hypothetical protein ATZ20_10710 [Sulfolobus acidocaldarius]
MTNMFSLLYPLISIVIGVVPLFIFKRNAYLLGIAAASYFTAIILKEIIQLSFRSFFITPTLPTYLSYGILTAIFEPGFAYLYLVLTKAKVNGQLGLSYGSYLAFYENAIFLGLLSLPNYLLLSVQFSVLSLALYGLERISSFILHLFWGFSSALSASKKNIKYLSVSMPYGMVDSVAAYYQLSHNISLVSTEIISLVVSISCLPIIVLWYKMDKRNQRLD